MFLDHTQRRSTVSRTPLEEWSARRRDLYLTTHDTHNRQISMPPVGFEPTISAGERLQAVIIAFRPAITYITKQYRCYNILDTPCKWSITAARQQHRCSNTDGRAVPLRYKLPTADKRMRSATQNPLHRLLRSDVGSYSAVHWHTYFICTETKPTKL